MNLMKANKVVTLIKLCLLFILTFPTQVYAAEITANHISDGNYVEISIKGDINDGDDIVFANLTRMIPASQGFVVLDSAGGKIIPALEIAKIISVKNFDTFVENASCASACGLIWLASRSPTLGKGGKVGFHGAYTPTSQINNESTRVGNALIGAYLARLELSEQAIRYITEASPARMVWLSEHDAMQIGLTNVRFTERRIVSIEHYNEAVLLEGREGETSAAALGLYQRSADEGFAGAQNNLGDRYETGSGVVQNKILAAYWYTRAAERGEPTAYYSLANLFAAEKDSSSLIEATKYAILATKYLEPGSNRDGAVALLNALTNRLPPSRRSHANELAERWVPLHLETAIIGDDPTPDK
jgi:hypothetical protein